MIELDITYDDWKNAKYYTSRCGCLVATALKRLGYTDIDVGPGNARADGKRYHSDQLFFDKVKGIHTDEFPFYDKSVIGKHITLCE